MRKLKKLLLAASGMALSGFLVSACAKDPISPSTPSVAPAEGSLGTVNAKSSAAGEYQRLRQSKKNDAPGAEYAKKSRSGYMVSSS